MVATWFLPSVSGGSRLNRCKGYTLLVVSMCSLVHVGIGFQPPINTKISRQVKGMLATGDIRTSKPSVLLAPTGSESTRRAQLRTIPSMAIKQEADDKFPRGGSANLVKDFVTQRSLQTLLYNLDVSHDGKLQFLENFLEHKGIMDFHHYGALRVGWKVYLQSLRKAAPFDVVHKRTVRRGGSKGNPYLTDQVFEYTVRIDPTGLADDLFDLRKQLADEWQEDLQLIAAENAELFRHHNAVMIKKQDEQLSLQHPLMHSRDTDSPLRKANYDLLEKYVTHVAAERVLHEMSRSRSQAHAYQWFKNWMATKGEKFNGDHGRNVGREFLLGLLSAPPVIISNTHANDGGEMAFIDPMDLAAKVMAERQCVADRWVVLLEEIENDHLELHRSYFQDCFEAQMTF